MRVAFRPGTPTVPEKVVVHWVDKIRLLVALFLDWNRYDKAFVAKHLIHHGSHPVKILIADLDEDRSGLSQKVTRNGDAIAQVGKVAVDAVAPSVAKGFDLFWLASDLL